MSVAELGYPCNVIRVCTILREVRMLFVLGLIPSVAELGYPCNVIRVCTILQDTRTLFIGGLNLAMAVEELKLFVHVTRACKILQGTSMLLLFVGGGGMWGVGVGGWALTGCG